MNLTEPSLAYIPAERSIDDFKPNSILLANEEVCELLNRFLEFKKTGQITQDCVRQIFLPIVKEIIAKFSPCGLGQICAWCESCADYNEDYRESSLVITGTNAWSAIFFSSHDTGVVMIQKIATASLLVELIKLAGCDLKRNCPEGKYTCMPLDIFRYDSHRIDELQVRLEAVTEKLGW